MKWDEVDVESVIYDFVRDQTGRTIFLSEFVGICLLFTVSLNNLFYLEKII